MGLMFLMPFFLMATLFLGYFLLGAYGVFVAIIVLRGRDFRHAVIGRRVENYLELQG